MCVRLDPGSFLPHPPQISRQPSQVAAHRYDKAHGLYKYGRAELEARRTKSAAGQALTKPSAIDSFAPGLVIFTTIVLAFGLVGVFRRAAPTGRMTVRLLIFPFLTLAGGALCRHTAYRQKYHTPAVQRYSEESAHWYLFFFEAIVGLLARHMLTNIGTSAQNAFAVAVAGVVEVAARATIVRQDEAWRRFSNTPFSPARRQKQLRAWSAAIGGAMVIETAWIFVTAACKLGFAPHPGAFDFGGQGDVTASVVCLDAFVALLFEVAVDGASLWLEARQGIPVDAWAAGLTPKWVAAHALVLLSSIAFALTAYAV